MSSLSPKKERCHKHLIKEEIVSTNIEKLSVMIHSSPIEVVDITVDSVIAPTESSSVNFLNRCRVSKSRARILLYI
ncbi:TPA: LOW QUALITY PROTEIN: hypothetical protein N0F65_004801 [Lagenidium giganteum]|uniref:Uncharacterized protein n=1 Tax=Lagenidium giganteum TaxID=4803 RepID=A0AAV2Z762_9STRA|nr:TPA: LOW QUALITY PROTEIN: hypothetical protein N0F65_004801 [Lagenidium giganteum]